ARFDMIHNNPSAARCDVEDQQPATQYQVKRRPAQSRIRDSVAMTIAANVQRFDVWHQSFVVQTTKERVPDDSYHLIRRPCSVAPQHGPSPERAAREIAQYHSFPEQSAAR